MTTKAVKTRRRKPRQDPRVAGIIKLADAVNEEASDYLEFLRRWGDRYSPRNCALLWVQCPGATSLHKYETWLRAGLKVRGGEKAIKLYQPRSRFNPAKVTAQNLDGEEVTGVTMVSLFDISQCDLLEPVAIDDPDVLAEVKRLRFEAVQLHPDKHPDDPGAHEAFKAAWAKYEQAKAGAERTPR